MRAITTIGLIVATAAGLIIASRGASSETTPEIGDRRLVVRPTSMNPGGGLDLASYGVAELTTEDGVTISTLHVRAVIVSTTRGLPWALDASEARLEAAQEAVAPAFVNSDVATLPIAILDPGERRTIDFYFPLPPKLVAHEGPVTFALTWPVNTPARVLRHAWFERAAAVAQPGSGVVAAGLGQHWWFDPTYPWSTYHHRPGIATPRPPRYVVMTRAPRWEETPAEAGDEQPRETECEQW